MMSIWFIYLFSSVVDVMFLLFVGDQFVFGLWCYSDIAPIISFLVYYCDAKLTIIPKRDFIFARVKTGQVGTWSPTE